MAEVVPMTVDSSSFKETSPSVLINDLESLYSLTTHLIKVVVRPIYLEEQSNPSEDQYVWAYHVRIENKSQEIVQLRSRTWMIIDAFGLTQEVHGSGVVGELPILKPDDIFEYASGTSLSTPSGLMYGSYHMLDMNGNDFDVTIPTFSLDSPYQTITLN